MAKYPRRSYEPTDGDCQAICPVTPIHNPKQPTLLCVVASRCRDFPGGLPGQDPHHGSLLQIHARQIPLMDTVSACAHSYRVTFSNHA